MTFCALARRQIKSDASSCSRIVAEGREVADVADAVGAADRVSPARKPTLEEWERRVEVAIEDNRAIPETKRHALVRAPRAAHFRADVLMIESACGLTKVERPEHQLGCIYNDDTCCGKGCFHTESLMLASMEEYVATPKGMRAAQFPVNASDAIHVYSDSNHIWIQLRRDVPTEQDIGRSSFKVALCIQPGTAHKLALELMNVAERTKVKRKVTATDSVAKAGKAKI